MFGLAGLGLFMLTGQRPRGPLLYDEPFKWKALALRLKIYDERDRPVAKMHWFVEYADGRQVLEGFSEDIEVAQALALERLAQRFG